MIRIERKQNGEIRVTANSKPLPLPPTGQVLVIVPRTEYRNYRTSTEESRK